MSSKKRTQFVDHVDNEMRSFPHLKQRAEFLRGYYKVERDLLGLSLPIQRGRHKRGYGPLDGLTRENQAKFWFEVWQRSELMESMSQAIFFFERWAIERRKLFAKKMIDNIYDPLWPFLIKMVDRCDNWVHSDGLSGLLSGGLEERSRERFPLMKKWNSDRNPWRRRQSVLSLHFYARFRKKPLPSSKTLPLIDALLEDDHFYVQRAVGWALRECYNVDARATLAYLERNITRVPPIGYYAAVEKLSPALKKKFAKMRADARKKISRSAVEKRGAR